MDWPVAAGGLVLAATLALAALGKLADADGSRRAARELGVPGALAGPVAAALPAAEATIAALLVLPGLTAWGAAAAAVLLGAFTVAIAANLALGRRPACHCFGRRSSSPLSGRVLARTGALAALAAWLAAQRPPLPRHAALGWLVPSWPRAWTAGLAAAAGLVALAAATSDLPARALRRTPARRLLRALAGPHGSPAAGPSPLPVGAPAPSFVLPAPDGTLVALSDLLARPPAVLVFVHPTCGPCNDVLREVPEWQERAGQAATIAVVSHGAPDDDARAGARHVLVDDAGAVTARYRVHGTPAAVVVDPDGRVAAVSAPASDAVRRLVADASSGNGGAHGHSR